MPDGRTGTNAGSALVAGDVTAVVVTRGDVPLDDILARLNAAGFRETLVWVNGVGLTIHRDGVATRSQDAGPEPFTDLSVYGRYAALYYAETSVVYVQDDDCIVSPPALERLLAAYQPGRIAALMPESRWPDYPDSCLVGWGSVFDRVLPAQALGRFALVQGLEVVLDALVTRPGFFLRECDVPFTVLTPHVKVPSELGLDWNHLPWAEDPARAMFKKPGRDAERARMYELARAVRDA